MCCSSVPKWLLFFSIACVASFATTCTLAQISITYSNKTEKPTAVGQYLQVFFDSANRKPNQSTILFNYFLESKHNVKPIRPSFTYEGMGWFCKQEWKFHQQTKIPLFLRLGSKNQTDYLEGKLR